MPITPKQHEVLMRPLNGTRIAKRSQGGKQLSYLESWEVRAHLIRIFGFGNFDIETLDAYHLGTREYGTDDKPMVEAIWYAKVKLTIRTVDTIETLDTEITNDLCTYTESAVGSASGPANMIGELHDNAVKTAASDAMKRCAINLGTQFGLSLYNEGQTADVVKDTLVKPEGYEKPEVAVTDEQVEALKHSLGATVVEEVKHGGEPQSADQG